MKESIKIILTVIIAFFGIILFANIGGGLGGILGLLILFGIIFSVILIWKSNPSEANNQMPHSEMNLKLRSDGAYISVMNDLPTKPYYAFYFNSLTNQASWLFDIGGVNSPLFNNNFSDLSRLMEKELKNATNKSIDFKILNRDFEFKMRNTIGGISVFKGIISNSNVISMRRIDYNELNIEEPSVNNEYEIYQFCAFNKANDWKRVLTK